MGMCETHDNSWQYILRSNINSLHKKCVSYGDGKGAVNAIGLYAYPWELFVMDSECFDALLCLWIWSMDR